MTETKKECSILTQAAQIGMSTVNVVMDGLSFFGHYNHMFMTMNKE